MAMDRVAFNESLRRSAGVFVVLLKDLRASIQHEDFFKVCVLKAGCLFPFPCQVHSWLLYSSTTSSFISISHTSLSSMLLKKGSEWRLLAS